VSRDLFTNLDDGKVLDPKAGTKETDHEENLKRIKEYNARWRQRNRLDQAVKQTIESNL
jgi:hypothetical protein